MMYRQADEMQIVPTVVRGLPLDRVIGRREEQGDRVAARPQLSQSHDHGDVHQRLRADVHDGRPLRQAALFARDQVAHRGAEKRRQARQAIEQQRELLRP